ncbi:MAG: DUF1275 domain-containing protein [Oscillospiraceae bacterium]|nr:DUF1275 domain-containing protein [Oscillospiraceae bacterium]
MIHHEVTEKKFLECERWYILTCLTFVGGFFGGYTYSVRGGVFCNAQTANFVLLAMSLGSGDWKQASYLCIPITAYFLGAVVSEAVADGIKHFHLIRWDTLLIIIEILVIFILGFIPDSAPYQISQVAINFIASMQYNTFRQADGVPMATTFCTNHLRQVGVFFTKGIRHKSITDIKRMGFYIAMLAVFVAGGTTATIICHQFAGKGIWFAILPLAIIAIDLLHADLKTEKNELNRIPKGH